MASLKKFPADLATTRGRAKAWSHSLLVDHALFRILYRNFSAVEPGILYRSNHPTPGQLAHAARRHGIRTVINLRGETSNGSDALSREAAARLGLTLIDMPFGSRRAPHKDRVLRLADIYRAMAPPALLHCKSGADRAGLAAALYILITGGSSARAQQELSWRFGHIRAAKTGVLDAFIALYAAGGEGKKPFLDWVREDYDEMGLRQSYRSGPIANFVTDRILRRE